MSTRPYDNPAIRIMKNYKPAMDSTQNKTEETNNNSFFKKPEEEKSNIEKPDIVSVLVSKIRQARERNNDRTI